MNVNEIGISVVDRGGQELDNVVMKMKVLKRVLLALLVTGVLASSAVAEDATIFDGKSLKGWKAPDMSFWSVRDGAITAESTAEKPCKENQFLVWHEEVGDFELIVKFRLVGGPKANSGIQVRSVVEADGHVKGYQIDMSQPDAAYLGAVYDERGRKMLALRGQKTVIKADGKKVSTPLPDADALLKAYKAGGWNEYRIHFKGNKLTVKINGKTTSVVIDEQESEREMKGVLALQMHSGPPMKVQFKDLVLNKL